VDIRVLGLGNVLMGDDGFGPYVVEALQAGYELPPEVSAMDLGTPGFDLAPFLIGADAIIVIDTVRSDGAPGDIRVYERDALIAHAPQPRLGPHDPGFTHMLLTLDFAGLGPPSVVLVGAIPHATAPHARLSAPLHDAVPRAVEAVVLQLRRFGADVTPRQYAAPIQPWWECEDLATLPGIPRT
jgi:hydrogenase maturation protease